MEKVTDRRAWMMLTAIVSAIAALGFFLNWAIRFHDHNNTDWIFLGTAAMFAIAAVVWLIRWLRTPRHPSERYL